MEKYTIDENENTPYTTYFGTKVSETDRAIRAGERGPTILNGMSLLHPPSYTDFESS